MQEMYNLVQRIGAYAYYICDLHGTLSKNAEDAMIFLDKETAVQYQGLFEYLFETTTGQIAKMSEISIRDSYLLFSRRITKTLVNQISDLRHDNKS